MEFMQVQTDCWYAFYQYKYTNIQEYELACMVNFWVRTTFMEMFTHSLHIWKCSLEIYFYVQTLQINHEFATNEFATNNMSVKPKTNFPRDGHSTAVIGTDPIDENNKDKVALLWYFSELHANLNKPPIHEAYTITFVEQPNSLSLDFCEDK